MKTTILFTAAMMLACSANASILTNHSFEDGMTGWTKIDGNPDGGTLIKTGSASDGVRFVQYTGNNQANAAVEQAFASVSGTPYRLSIDYASLNKEFEDLAIRVIVTSDGGTLGDLLDATVDTFTHDTVNDIITYQTFDAGTFIGTGGSATARIQEASSDSDGAAPLLDNVVLTEVPEPATLSLIGIGALVCLRRRVG